jgi:hypothetical protein
MVTFAQEATAKPAQRRGHSAQPCSGAKELPHAHSIQRSAACQPQNTASKNASPATARSRSARTWQQPQAFPRMASRPSQMTIITKAEIGSAHSRARLPSSWLRLRTESLPAFENDESRTGRADQACSVEKPWQQLLVNCAPRADEKPKTS